MATVTDLPTSNDTPTDQLVAYAYVLTLQFSLGQGLSHYTAETRGVVDLPRGASRHDVCEELRRRMIAQARQQQPGLHQEPTTVFFSLERDALCPV